MPTSIQYRTGEASLSMNLPIQKIRIEVPDLSVDEAIPQFAVAIDAQINRDDASDDFIQEELHSVRSRSDSSR